MNKIETISDVLYSYFSSVYCDDCRYNTDSPEEYRCDDCHRKYMNWALSKGGSEWLAEKIIEELKD